MRLPRTGGREFRAADSGLEDDAAQKTVKTGKTEREGAVVRAIAVELRDVGSVRLLYIDCVRRSLTVYGNLSPTDFT
jgi:hypothetical protein